ncbi:MAG: cadmium-translocating P-type ATPase [Acidimicrobiia bacterium]|nr:cadmium-translocating P-type ATPase [Acidimicrobiia bacterium]
MTQPDTDIGPDDTDEHEEPYRGSWWGFPPLRNAVLSGALLAATFALERFEVIPTSAAIGLYVVAAVLGASHWGREAFETITRPRIDIDVLMLVATVGSAALGLWEEAAFLAFLYGGAEGLEEYTYDRTRGAIRALLDLAPKDATVLRNGQETVVVAEELTPGDVMLVRPGESLATDGTIRAGSTSLDESPVTGESVPVEKGPGDEVFAGTVNLTGAVEVTVIRAFADNTLSQIIHLVEEAQEEKTQTQRLIDRFGTYYSPAILGAAALLAVVPLLFGGDPSVWIRRAVTLAVAGAPCALVMSTPVAVASAIGSAGKRGVLIKGGIHLENLGRVRVLAMDKTGTLTRGRPQVTDLIPFADTDPAELLRVAAAVEASSEHPLAQAIVRRAEADGIVTRRADGFEALTGAGARARSDGDEVYVGSVTLFADLGADIEDKLGIVEELREQGKTVVLVGRPDRVVGLVALRDEYRTEAPEAIEALHHSGIADIVMLTGDNPRTAAAIAHHLGIDQVRAELKPADKSRAITELQTTLGPVAMVGDGINDAPALATATVGIAMGAAGSDVAIETADVALLGEDLHHLPDVLTHARRAGRIMRQNLALSGAILITLVPLAALGILGLATVVATHEIAEVFVIANGIRAGRAANNSR